MQGCELTVCTGAYEEPTRRSGPGDGCGTMGRMEMPMNERSPEDPHNPQDLQSSQNPQVLVVGPDGMALGGGAGGTGGEGEEPREIPVTEMVEQPAKVMRIGSMIKQL